MANAWKWVPSVYTAEGIPYVAVNVLTVLIYTQLGIPKGEMALYTGCLYLPWVIKPFWSPFVDVVSTKRHWTLTMQLLLAGAFMAAALLLPTPFFFPATLAAFWTIAFCSATHDIAADGYYMLALDEKEQARFVGIRSTFYRIASILTQGTLVMGVGYLADRTGEAAESWSAGIGLLGIVFLLLWLWNSRMMPRPIADRPQVAGKTAPDILKGFATSFATFFRKPAIVGSLLFMLLFRFPEALCVKMIPPFLLEVREAGGLGLSVAEIGFANGTVGVIALLAGGILGGVAIAKGGLRKWLYPMAAALTLPCILYCWLAQTQPESLTLVCTAIGVEQFGYGFGFTAYMMYLMYFSRGEMQTSHYAFCTAFMALGMMLPGMAAGWLCEALASRSLFGLPESGANPQYLNFFWIVMASCTLTFLAVAIVRRR